MNNAPPVSDLRSRILSASKADGIPKGDSGLWYVRKLAMKEEFCGGANGIVPPGQYTHLFKWTDKTIHLTQGELIMHDYPNELAKHLHFMMNASGAVLITGLGLGCVVRGCLANPAIKMVTVIEKSCDVLKLVGPFMPKMDRLKIIQADALEWVKNTTEQFDYAWHDLWTDESAGEPHLQVQHMQLICDLHGKAQHQGAWLFPRYYKKLMRNLGVIA